MNLSVTVTGLEEMQAKAVSETVNAPVAAAVEAIGQELATPKGSGMGVRVNALALTVEGMAATIETSLVWPRTSGKTWEVKTVEDFEAIAQRALADADTKIVQTWEG